MPRLSQLLLAIGALAAASTVVAASLQDELKACRQIGDASRRLACYDLVQLQGGDSPAATAVAAAVKPTSAADPVAAFGQERLRQRPDAPAEIKQIESRIRGKFMGWDPGTRLELDNGQVWRIADDSNATYELQAPRVFVRRGLLGAFYIEVEGVPFQARVIRVR